MSEATGVTTETGTASEIAITIALTGDHASEILIATATVIVSVIEEIAAIETVIAVTETASAGTDTEMRSEQGVPGIETGVMEETILTGTGELGL